MYLRLGFLQKGCQLLHALRLDQIQRQRPQRGFQLTGQSLHPVSPAGHAPEFIQAALLVQPPEKRRAQPGGRTCYNGNFHPVSLPLRFRLPVLPAFTTLF